MGLSLREKVLFLAIACISLSVTLAGGDGVISENVAPSAYEDVDNWIVRETHESSTIEGNTKRLYELGPSDTIVGNTALCNMGGSPWAASNVMVKMAGVMKTNTSVFPEKRGDGMCARMETRYESMKVFGLVDIGVIATGFVFLGTVHESIKGTRNPQAMPQSRASFSKKPKALWSDYEVKAAPKRNRVRSTGLSRKSTMAGQDSLATILLLRKRWEDAEGSVYSKRVGTMVRRHTEPTPDWVNDVIYSILCRNIISKPEYKSYMRTQIEECYASNSKGKSAPIQEVGWAEPDGAPMYMVLQLTSSCKGAYIGSPGNTLWIDNVELIY